LDAAPTWIRTVADGVELALLVQPRASRTAVAGEQDGRLKVRLAAAPVDGEANAALLEFIGDSLGIPRARVVLVRGGTGRRKTVLARGTTAAGIRDALLAGVAAS